MASDVKSSITQEQADSQEVACLVAAGKKVTDPGLRQRIRARADEVRQQILDKHGVAEWAADMIRDARHE